MGTRADVRRALEELRRAVAAAGLAVAPLVCGWRQFGVDGEVRPPGLYFEGEARTPVLVSEHEAPSADEVRRHFPLAEHLPLLIGGEAALTLL